MNNFQQKSQQTREQHYAYKCSGSPFKNDSQSGKAIVLGSLQSKRSPSNVSRKSLTLNMVDTVE